MRLLLTKYGQQPVANNDKKSVGGGGGELQTNSNFKTMGNFALAVVRCIEWPLNRGHKCNRDWRSIS